MQNLKNISGKAESENQPTTTTTTQTKKQKQTKTNHNFTPYLYFVTKYWWMNMYVCNILNNDFINRWKVSEEMSYYSDTVTILK